MNNAALSEGLADALGRIVAETRRSFAKDLALLEAEGRAFMAELTARRVTIEAEINARVAEALAKLRDGEPGPQGPAGRDGADGVNGRDGKDGAGIESLMAVPEEVAWITAKSVQMLAESPAVHSTAADAAAVAVPAITLNFHNPGNDKPRKKSITMRKDAEGRMIGADVTELEEA